MEKIKLGKKKFFSLGFGIFFLIFQISFADVFFKF